MTYAFGDRYEGQLRDGVPYGRGKYTFADGGYYRGEYLAQRSGYSHGKKFPMCNGKRHGKGVRLWASGSKYEGDWEDDVPHGSGIFTAANGEQYVGEIQRPVAGMSHVWPCRWILLCLPSRHQACQ